MPLIDNRKIIKNEIDYDKLAESIAKGIQKNKEEEKNALQIEEDILNRNWRKTIGYKDHVPGEKWYKKVALSVSNFFVGLKTFVFYKRDYAKEAKFSFAFMAMICSIIFGTLKWIFLLLSCAITYGMIFEYLSYWNVISLIIMLFFANLMRIIELEIDMMKSNEMINMIFSSLMAFIAALFTVLAFVWR